MAHMIRTFIVFVLSNYSLSFLILGLIVAGVALARSTKAVGPAVFIDTFLAWHVFFVIGVGYFYNFIAHVFFGTMAAAFIGWADSPFQFEVGVASLGFAVVGFLAAFRGFELRLAAILGPSFFSLGAAIGHAYQMVTAHNFAPGNAGIIFYTDIIIPLVGLALLSLQWRIGKREAIARPSTAGLT